MKVAVEIEQKHIDKLNEAVGYDLKLDEEHDIEIADAIITLIENCM